MRLGVLSGYAYNSPNQHCFKNKIVGILVMYMFSEFHNNYLARDKMLRHTFQHFEIACAIALIYFLGLHQPYSHFDLFILLFFTYLPDLDGVSSTFIWYKSNPIAKGVRDRLLVGELREALSFGTIYHKQLNRLMFHNLVVYPFIWTVFIWALANGYHRTSLAAAALLGHFTFDLSDDVFQMGNIKNWLWPFHLLFPKWHFFDPNKITFPIPQMAKHITTEPTDYLFKRTLQRK